MEVVKSKNGTTRYDTAFYIAENSLLGRLCRVSYKEVVEGKPPAYRIGTLNDNGTWNIYDLTTDYFEELDLGILKELKMIGEIDLDEKERKNLEKLLKRPPEE